MLSNAVFRCLPRLSCALLAAFFLIASLPAAAMDLKAAERAMRAGDYETAIREAQPLAEQGNNAARQVVEVAKAMLEAKRQREESLAIAEAAADRFSLGKRAYDREDYEQAYEAWIPAAEAGNRDAQFWIGELYSEGKGVEQDFDTAHTFYLRAALQGHPRAQYNAGEFLTFAPEIGGIPENQQALGFDLLLRAATGGETIAYVSIAGAYCFGDGVEEDTILADVWMALALEHQNEFDLFEGKQCDRLTPLTKEYHREVLRRAEALRYAYGLKHIRPPVNPHSSN